MSRIVGGFAVGVANLHFFSTLLNFWCPSFFILVKTNQSFWKVWSVNKVNNL